MSIPYINKIGTGSTTNKIIITGVNWDTDYKGYYIQIKNEIKKITISSRKEITIEGDFTNVPLSGDIYILLPNNIKSIKYGIIGGGSTKLNLNIKLDKTYKDNYILVNNEVKIIQTINLDNIELDSELVLYPGEVYAIFIDNPDTILYGINTGFIGGKNNFYILIASLILCILILSSISSIFMMGYTGDTGDTGDNIGNTVKGILEASRMPVTINVSTNPVYYPNKFMPESTIN